MVEVKVENGGVDLRVEGRAIDVLAEMSAVVMRLYEFLEDKDDDMAELFKMTVQDEKSPVWHMNELKEKAQADDDDDDCELCTKLDAAIECLKALEKAMRDDDDEEDDSKPEEEPKPKRRKPVSKGKKA